MIVWGNTIEHGFTWKMEDGKWKMLNAIEHGKHGFTWKMVNVERKQNPDSIVHAST